MMEFLDVDLIIGEERGGRGWKGGRKEGVRICAEERGFRNCEISGIW